MAKADFVLVIVSGRTLTRSSPKNSTICTIPSRAPLIYDTNSVGAIDIGYLLSGTRCLHIARWPYRAAAKRGDPCPWPNTRSIAAEHKQTHGKPPTCTHRTVFPCRGDLCRLSTPPENLAGEWGSILYLRMAL